MKDIKNVLITDIDGVIAGLKVRHELANNYVANELGTGIIDITDKKVKKLFYSEKAFFNPDFIRHDEMLPEASFVWEALEYVDHIIFLTSRPHWLLEETTMWLQNKKLYHPELMSVICKDYASNVKYLTNVEWYSVFVTEAGRKFLRVFFVHKTLAVLQAVENISCHYLYTGSSLSMVSDEIKKRAPYLRDFHEQKAMVYAPDFSTFNTLSR